MLAPDGVNSGPNGQTKAKPGCRRPGMVNRRPSDQPKRTSIAFGKVRLKIFSAQFGPIWVPTLDQIGESAN